VAGIGPDEKIQLDGRKRDQFRWFPRRFDPTRALALPRSVGAPARTLSSDGNEITLQTNYLAR
jgi:hypothetical protein